MPRNVMIELGIAIALNRPILLLRHASNRELSLPKGLQCISDQILEFSGITTLRKVFTESLSRWINVAPETAWWNRYCTFGGRVCDFREAHPRAKQLGKKELCCTILDGSDSCRSDFRGVIEEVLDRFDDVTYTYLDSLSIEEGYNFLLCSYCQITRSSPFAIYRITPQTPAEAFVSIGISLALEAHFEYKVQKILIAENLQDIPSLLAGYEVVVAPNDQTKKKYLKRFVPEVIRNIHKTVWKLRPLPFIETAISTKMGSTLNNQSDDVFSKPENKVMPQSGEEGNWYEELQENIDNLRAEISELRVGLQIIRDHPINLETWEEETSPQGAKPIEIFSHTDCVSMLLTKIQEKSLKVVTKEEIAESERKLKSMSISLD